MTFAQLTHNTDLRDQLIKKFEPLMPGGAEEAKIPMRHHVDDNIFGVVPLEIGMETKDQKYLSYGQEWADKQWNNPTPDGLSDETRFWIDDMYMLTILQLEAYRATGDKKYLDRDATEMAAYLDKLQQPNGLFYHAPDVPFFWGRGDGWVAAGMAETLRDLPADHPQRARIMKGYKLMMASLLQYQGKDGMWRQLIDHDEAWPETSSTAMFTFAMITGVKNGWLDPLHLRARRAQSLARGRRLHRPEQRHRRSLRRHQQAEQSRLLPGAPPPDRRLPRSGADSLVGVSAVALGRIQPNRKFRVPRVRSAAAEDLGSPRRIPRRPQCADKSRLTPQTPLTPQAPLFSTQSSRVR